MITGHATTSRKSAFTLIELSIVLVIIGLLVGGVLVGRDLIKSAEVRSQISQIEKFKVAVNTFKLKYGSLPGDMPPAQAAANGFFTFVGTYAGSSTGGRAYGDNNGRINEYGEFYVFWKHLSEAKLIDGQYGGTSVGNGDYLDTDASHLSGGDPSNWGSSLPLPLTQAQNDKFLPRHKLTSTVYNVSVYPTFNNSILDISNRKSFNNFFYIATTANELSSIDTKIDDGKPKTGIVLDWYSDADAPSVCNDYLSLFPDISYNLNPTAANWIDASSFLGDQACHAIFLW